MALLTHNRSITCSIACLLLALSACAPTVKVPAPMEKSTLSATERFIKPYTIGIGDELAINFFFAPELNDVMQVRPDGRISVMFIQDIIASGKTPEQLSTEIKEKLSQYIKQPDMVIVVRSFAGQKAYVGGEVFKPGPVQLTKNENLMQVLTEAGWVTPAARRNEVVLVRRSEDGKEKAYALNIDKIISGEDMSQNVFIYPGDQVLVPPSDAAAFDRWVDQNIRQALPFGTSVVVTNN